MKSWVNIACFLLANLGYALAINLFYVGNNIAAGGLAGIGVILNHLFAFPVGLSVFIMNIPIVLWGLKIKGKKYILISLIATGMFSLMVDLLSFLPCVTDDKFVAVVCGGILYGVSASLAIKAQISTGGTDLLAKLIITYIKTASIGTLLLCIDGSIVLLAMIVYGNVEAGIYAILAIAVCSIVTDKIKSSFNKAEVFCIFPNKNVEEISNAILYEMNRGVTLLKGQGQYTHNTRDILVVVVKPAEVPKLKKIIKSYDPAAFVILHPATEIIGNGFEDIDLTKTVNNK